MSAEYTGKHIAIVPEGPGKMEISVVCSDIQGTDGFTFSVPANVSHEHLWSDDCEQEWSNSEHLIADGSPTGGGKVLSPAVRVTPQNLTVSHCVKDLWWEMYCEVTKFKYMAHYKASNDTMPTENTPGSEYHWNILTWLIPVLTFLIVIFLIYMWKSKRISRGFCRSSGVTSQQDPRNDPSGEDKDSMPLKPLSSLESKPSPQDQPSVESRSLVSQDRDPNQE